MDLDLAKSFLRSDTNAPSSLAPVGAGEPIPDISLTPQTNAALAATMPASGTDAELLRSMDAEYKAKNEIPGVPLDVESGASPWERFNLSFKREKANQISYLQKRYGEDSVREDTSGGLIVRVMDSDTGKPKDLLVDENRMSLKDLIDLSGSVPEVAGGIVATLKGRKLPGLANLNKFLSLQRDVAATAIGSETAGAVKDVAENVIEQGKPKFGEVLKERAGMALADVAVGEATMGLGRIFKFAQSPFAGSRGEVQFDAIAAQKYFKDKYGVEVPLSIGESTGSPLVSRTEAFMEKLPGGGTPFKELKGQQEEQLRKLQMIMMGKAPPTDEEVGKALISKIEDTIKPAQKAVQVGRQAVQESGTAEIEGIVTGLTLPERQLLKSATGQEVRDAVIAKRDVAKAEADRLYDAVRAMPGGTGKTFDTFDLSKEATDILKAIPRKGNVTLEAFAPPDVVNRLKTLIDLKGNKLSLSELQQMRRDTIEAIGNTEGVPGRGAHYLGQISDALTKAIEDGTKAMPGGGLKTALDAANSHYKNEVVPFNRVGITELFRRPDEAGAISNSEIISRLFGGGKAVENYQLMKETLTPASPQFTKVKRAIADNLLERSRMAGGDLIDPESFINNLTSFKRDYKEIADDIFGPQFTKMIRSAKTMSLIDLSSAEKEALGMGGTISGSKISGDEFKALLADPNPTAGKLRALIKAEGVKDTLYKNDLMRAVAKGELPDKTINPSDFVNRFLDSASPDDVKQVMGLVGTGPLLDDVRAKLVEQLFRKAGRSATSGDIGKLMSGDPTRIMSATSLFKQIEDPEVLKKIEAVLGPDVTKDVRQYIKILNAGENKEASFKAAGGLAAGMQIAALTRSGPLKYMYAAGKDWLVASLMTRQPLRAWLSSVPNASDPGFVSLLLSSPPFLEAVTKEFPKGNAAEAFISSIKSSVDRWIHDEAVMKPAPQSDFEKRQQLMKEFLHK